MRVWRLFALCLLTAACGAANPLKAPVQLINFPQSSEASMRDRLVLDGVSGVIGGKCDAPMVFYMGRKDLGGAKAGLSKLEADGTCSVWLDDTRADTSTEINILIHEVGHCLGLDHSPNRESVMYPVVGGGVRPGMFGDFKAVRP